MDAQIKQILEQNATLLRVIEEQQAQFNLQRPVAPADRSEAIIESLSRAIQDFCYDPDNGDIFGVWYSRYEDLFKEDAKNLNEAARVRLLIRKLDAKAYEQYVNYILPKHPREYSFDETIVHLKKIFGRQTSLFNLRFNCLQFTKNNLDDFVTYAGQVNKHCENFDLNKITSNQFKSLIFICGLRSSKDNEIRTRLLSKFNTDENVNLEKLIEECSLIINLKRDTNLIEHPQSTKSVQAIKKSVTSKPNKVKHESKTPTGSSKSETGPKSPCWSCGAMHYSQDCTFKNHKCTQCHNTGHKEGYCACFNRVKKNKTSTTQMSSKSVFSSNQVDVCNTHRKYVTVKVNDVFVDLQVDTASDVTIISNEIWMKLGSPSTQPTTHTIKSASGTPINILGEIIVQMSLGDKMETGKLFVSDFNDINLLGIDWIERFDLWSIPLGEVCNNVIEFSPITSEFLQDKFSNVFDDSLGLCTKVQAKLHLKQNAHPIFCPKRPVPYAAQDKVERELNRLQDLGIISPIDFSEWAAPIVVVQKSSGNVRICADYKTGLNEQLESNQHPLPLVDDIFAKLANATVFSQLDLSDAFLQVEVDETHRKILAINTHRGLFQFNRLPPGVKSAPGIFQSIVDSMIAGLNNVAAYMDDIIISGKNHAEHRENLFKLLERIQEYGFKLKINKCSFGLSQIKFLGHIVDKDGLRPDPAKIEVIQQLPTPHDVSTLRSFLGAINYYGKFVPSLRNYRGPLDDLLKNDVTFNWSDICQQSFEKLKSILASDLLVTHYNPEHEIIVAADASSYGLGAVILHRFPDGTQKAIYHAARSLTPAEKNYGQIEKEGLALIFAVTKFHKMIFGRKFLLQTDHKPLLAIFGSKKGIPVHTANRLQRWATTLIGYDFTIKHLSSEGFGHADVLSRLINEHSRQSEDYVIASIEIENDVNQIFTDITNVLPLSFQMVQQATENDVVLQSVIQLVQNGWPKKQNQIENEDVAKFFNRKNSLTVVSRCLMYGERIVIPSTYHKRLLKQFHKGHPGIEAMKTLMRSYVFWVGIDQDIEDYVKRCTNCAVTAKSPIKSLLHSWPATTKPWERIHIDYAGPINGQYYLVIVDAYSKWPEMIKTPKITTTATIEILKRVFANFGLPEKLISDNGTQFTSARFKQFCLENGIEHIFTAPYHPQSNGQAERFVDTLKRTLQKHEGEGILDDEILNTFLLYYRTTPNRNVPGNGSPSTIMFGRTLRTSNDLLRRPSTVILTDIRNHAQEHQFNIKHGAKERTFKNGDLVYAQVHTQNEKDWVSGEVIERIGGVMFNVWITGKRVGLFRFHANQLRERYGSQESYQTTPIPLDVLIEAFDLPNIETPATAFEDANISQPGIVEQLPPPFQPQSSSRRAARDRRIPGHLSDYVLS